MKVQVVVSLFLMFLNNRKMRLCQVFTNTYKLFETKEIAARLSIETTEGMRFFFEADLLKLRICLPHGLQLRSRNDLFNEFFQDNIQLLNLK